MVKLPKVPNLTDLAYLSVKRHLLDGSLAEGARLTEESIASQLGISKSPVREALNRLETEGLLYIESRRGAYVRALSKAEIRDLYDLRELLEVHAVGTTEVTAELLDSLADSVEKTRRYLLNDDKLAHVEEDMRFHGLIAASTHNGELGRVLANVQQKCLLPRAKTYYLSAPMAPASHHRIYDALREGDQTLAQQAMSEHIRFVRDSLLDSLEDDAVDEDITTEAGTLALK